VPRTVLDATEGEDEALLDEAVRRVYDIERDHADLRTATTGDAAANAARFDTLRRAYRIRREFRYTTVELKHGRPALALALAALGFGRDDGGRGGA
jgi:hypothetical protein